MFGPVGRIDIGILYRVPGMDHLPVADIDPYMGYRRARRVGAGEENQVSRLGVLSETGVLMLKSPWAVERPTLATPL